MAEQPFDTSTRSGIARPVNLVGVHTNTSRRVNESFYTTCNGAGVRATLIG